MRPISSSLLAVPFLSLALLMPGCGGEDVNLGRRRQVDSYTQAPAVQADVLFVIDNSSSMRSSQDKLLAAFDAFIDGLEAIQSDFHIGVTTTDVSTPERRGAMIKVTPRETGVESAFISSDMDHYQDLFREAVEEVGTSGDVFEAGLEAASAALLPEVRGGVGDTVNEGFLRQEAKLAVVWISDEDDCSQDGTLPLEDPNECYLRQFQSQLVPVQEFVADYLGLKFRDQDVVLGAIVGVAPSDACGDAGFARGDRYISAVELVGGVVGDICQGDFDNIMEELGVNAAGQRTVFQLSRTPDPESIEVYVEPKGGESVEQTTGWSYLADANAVSFVGDAVPPRDSTIQISYVVVAN